MGDHCDPNSEITLIKVPKFLANHWRESENQSYMGYLKKNDDGTIDELLVKFEGKQRRFLSRANHLSCPMAVQIRDANAPIESMGRFKRSLTIYPKLDSLYKSEIKERHIVTNIHKARGTAHEARSEPNNDRSATLFKYYNPNAEGASTIAHGAGADYVPSKQDTPYSRSKTKGNLSYPSIVSVGIDAWR
ncbi:membrane protein, putative [Babesia bigemina]|uniref:Membrane protein, putative n=1 Tax=Babesia bigemina TaxID=5866 RepID=A0A061DDE9_BABBI|nr:membrane protein, putative [Babesia bigemina]CDR96220.1 membrane protein, putative [Babesia bigemina]|eukprot:XP_012768406.1 membrane protein, putative [Babesia bigemina]